MAEQDRFRQVDDDFKLHNEVLVVITDADGGAPPQAVVFWRDTTGGDVSEIEPTGVEDALAAAKAKAEALGREIVVQLEAEDIWWPRWGTLT